MMRHNCSAARSSITAVPYACTYNMQRGGCSMHSCNLQSSLVCFPECADWYQYRVLIIKRQLAVTWDSNTSTDNDSDGLNRRNWGHREGRQPVGEGACEKGDCCGGDNNLSVFMCRNRQAHNAMHRPKYLQQGQCSSCQLPLHDTQFSLRTASSTVQQHLYSVRVTKCVCCRRTHTGA